MMKTVRGVLVASVLLSSLALGACSTGNVTITTTSLPNGILNQAYSQQLQGQNVSTWSVLAGSLPPGLQVSTSGLVFGTPTAVGTFPFTVQANQDTTTTSPTVSQALSITITAS